MKDLEYQGDSEDIDFPPVKYSDDILFKDKTNHSFFNKLKRFIKLNLKCVIILLSIIITLIIAIILILFYTLRKSQKDKIINEEWTGGFITLKLTNINQSEDNVTVFNYEKMNLTKGDFVVNENNNALENKRILEEDNIKKNIYKIKNKEIQDISFNIRFKRPITSMNEMFKDNIYLYSINFNNLITNEIENINSAFKNCINLINVDFGNFDNNKIESMDNTFDNCSSVKKIDLSSFEFNNINSMVNTFKRCENLEYLRMDNFVFYYYINTSGIFESVNEGINLIINEEKNISYINNEYNLKKIISKGDNCTSFIPNCKICNSNYFCEKCQDNYTVSYSNLQCNLNNESLTNDSTVPTIIITAEPTTNITAEPSTNITAEHTTNITAKTTTNITAEPSTNITAEHTTNITAEHTTNITAVPTTNITAEYTTNITAEPSTSTTPNLPQIQQPNLPQVQQLNLPQIQ